MGLRFRKKQAGVKFKKSSCKKMELQIKDGK